jgi:CDP-diacylglycerol--serine O-phosphatidyltransferase
MFCAIKISNLLTYLSGFMSLLAVYFATRRNVSAVGLCIGLSSLFDLLDGKFASCFQRTEREKKMGVQIDSLTDGVAFGFAPVLCLTLLGQGGIGWLLAGGFYLIAALTRLSFYNVVSEEEEDKNFVGIPTTVIGILWTLLLLWPGLLSWAGVLFLVFGFLMLLPMKIRRPGGKGLVLVIFTLLIFIFFHVTRMIHGV